MSIVDERLTVSHCWYRAGTRGILDFMEFPSHFLEKFVYNEHTLPLIAKHHSTGTESHRRFQYGCDQGMKKAFCVDAVIAGKPLPQGHVKALIEDRSVFAASTLESQVCSLIQCLITRCIRIDSAVMIVHLSVSLPAYADGV